MVLYVDETECPEYFIVTGLLVNSKQDIDMAFKHFKKHALTINISRKKKAILCTEFKSTILDSHFPNVKKVMLKELNNISHCVIFTCFVKKGQKFQQNDKERTYINSIAKIVQNCDTPVEVLFDRFRINSFEKDIIKKLSSLSNVVSASPVDSQKEYGIQFVDNLCSAIRLKKTENDTEDFYTLIDKWVKEV